MDYSLRVKILEKFRTLEQSSQVSLFKADGTDIWPLVRNFIFSNALAESGSAKKQNSSSGKKLRTFITAMNNFLALSSSLRKNDVLFLGSDSYRITHAGESFNRYFDPLMDHLNGKQVSTLLLDHKVEGQVFPLHQPHRVRSLMYVDSLFRLHRQILEKCGLRTPITIEGLREIENIFREFNQELNLKLELKKFQSYVSSIWDWSKLFDFVLSLVRPEIIFMSCYYSQAMYSLSLVARRRKIPTVDVQHGAQGSMHAHYAFFTAIPKEGYALLPKYFWCWDQHSQGVISGWISQQNFHKVFVGGNPWQQYLSQHKTASQVNPPRPMILYTLQLNIPLVDDYVLKAILDSRQKFFWWLRLHPRTTPEESADLRARLESYGILGDVTLETGTLSSLTSLLEVSSVHLSKFSGSIREASEAGIPTVILDQTGADIFVNEITDQRAVYIGEKTTSNLLSKIESLTTKKLTQLERVDSLSVLDRLLTGK